ncbi:MAG: glutamate--tRNA ligase [Flavobacteriales bacterium]
MSDLKPRVRFAPSPTGPLHMGGVRTALYNYLFAKKHGGTFILRIEDTDQTRYVEGAEDYIMSALNWCNLLPQEGPGLGGQHGPYRQSERKEMYAKYADQLIDSGNAYYAFDTAEELDTKRKSAEKGDWRYGIGTREGMNNSLGMNEEELTKRFATDAPYVIRFKTPENETITFTDEIRDEVSFDSKVLDDKVIFKSDGMPTYHLANIVDDHLMEITHVIRGEEWLPSAPLHVLLYRAFGWEAPKFAHLPLILKPTGNGKLSKRDGAKFGFPVFPLEWFDHKENETYSGYKEEGYLPEAFTNMLLMLGWNPGTEQELFTHDEMVKAFSLDRVVKSGARFDPDKAKWFNENWLRNLSNQDILVLLQPLAAEKEIGMSEYKLSELIGLLKERVSFIHEFLEAGYLFGAPQSYDEKTVKKKWKDQSAELMKELASKFATLKDFNAVTAKETFSAFMAEKEVGFGQLGPALRLLLTGLGGGPDLFEIMNFLGKEESLSRMEAGSPAIVTMKSQM